MYLYIHVPLLVEERFSNSKIFLKRNVLGLVGISREVWRSHNKITSVVEVWTFLELHLERDKLCILNSTLLLSLLVMKCLKISPE